MNLVKLEVEDLSPQTQEALRVYATIRKITQRQALRALLMQVTETMEQNKSLKTVDKAVEHLCVTGSMVLHFRH